MDKTVEDSLYFQVMAEGGVLLPVLTESSDPETLFFGYLTIFHYEGDVDTNLYGLLVPDFIKSASAIWKNHSTDMSRPSIIVLFCVCAIASGAAPRKKVNQDDGKIIDGFETSITELPYQVSLQNEHSHVCGGAILDATHILTAAHCVERFQVSDLTVRVGSDFHESEGNIHKVKKAVMHPKYNKDTSNNDIAVLTLDSPISFSASAKPIELAGTEPSVGDTVTISGWGARFLGDGSTWSLRSVTVPVISKAVCKQLYAGINTVTKKMWCAGYLEGGRDSCQGDSGGPAVVNGKLAGVVSWGTGCGKKNAPGVYASVPKFLDWINAQTKSGKKRGARS